MKLLITAIVLLLLFLAVIVYGSQNYNLVSETEYHNLMYGIRDEELLREFDKRHP